LSTVDIKILGKKRIKKYNELKNKITDMDVEILNHQEDDNSISATLKVGSKETFKKLRGYIKSLGIQYHNNFY